jgi:hypothetical protein
MTYGQKTEWRESVPIAIVETATEFVSSAAAPP